MSESIITSNPPQKGARNSRVKFLAFLHTPESHGIAQKSQECPGSPSFPGICLLKIPGKPRENFLHVCFLGFSLFAKKPRASDFFYHCIYISALCIVCLTVVTFFLYLKTDTALCVVLYTTSVIDMSSAIVLCYIICRSIPSCYQLYKHCSSRFELVGKKHIYFYITNCRQYCFSLLGLISAVLMSRMEVKLKKPPQMSHTCGTSKPCQSALLYI